MARRLYGDVDAAIGKPVQINFTDYTVCGVVENVNRFCEFAWSEVYAPLFFECDSHDKEAWRNSGKSYHYYLGALFR